MNIAAINKGFVDNFERYAPYDFYVFYPNYVTRYDYNRAVDGHIADVDSSYVLTHSAIRRFVRKIVNNEDDLYTDLLSAYTKQLPSNKVYDFEDRKLVVRHMRGHWTTASSMKEINVYFNNPLFGTTSIDLAHNFYMCWVGGYQRNRVYYGDLIVPVARQRFGPTVRNESILPVHIVRGITAPDVINGTGLIVEDWIESRTEYDSDDWNRETSDDSNLTVERRYRIEGVTDYGEYRLIYETPDGTEEVLYFESTSDESGIITRSSIPDGITTYRIERITDCSEMNSNAY